MHVGIVLHGFRKIVGGVQQLLEPARLAEFKQNVSALNNRATFEIPEILAKLLEESVEGSENSPASTAPPANISA